jgi:hypothetical protein
MGNIKNKLSVETKLKINLKVVSILNNVTSVLWENLKQNRLKLLESVMETLGRKAVGVRMYKYFFFNSFISNENYSDSIS